MSKKVTSNDEAVDNNTAGDILSAAGAAVKDVAANVAEGAKEAAEKASSWASAAGGIIVSIWTGGVIAVNEAIKRGSKPTSAEIGEFLIAAKGSQEPTDVLQDAVILYYRLTGKTMRLVKETIEKETNGVRTTAEELCDGVVSSGGELSCKASTAILRRMAAAALNDALHMS